MPTKPKAAPAKPARKKSARSAAKPTMRSRAKPATPAEPPQSKRAQLIALLQTHQGGTLEQMMKLTGWQAHTVRGAISGVLRKQMGLSVTLEARTEGGPKAYRITA